MRYFHTHTWKRGARGADILGFVCPARRLLPAMMPLRDKSVWAKRSKRSRSTHTHTDTSRNTPTCSSEPTAKNGRKGKAPGNRKEKGAHGTPPRRKRTHACTQTRNRCCTHETISSVRCHARVAAATGVGIGAATDCRTSSRTNQRLQKQGLSNPLRTSATTLGTTTASGADKRRRLPSQPVRRASATPDPGSVVLRRSASAARLRCLKHGDPCPPPT